MSARTRGRITPSGHCTADGSTTDTVPSLGARIILTVMVLAFVVWMTGCATPTTLVNKTVQVETGPPLAIAVYPAIVVEGAGVQVTWRVDPDDANREWCIAFEGQNGAPGWRSFCEQSFRRIRQQMMEPVAGKYDVTLSVTRSDGRTRRVSTPLCVSSMDVSCTTSSTFPEIGGTNDGPADSFERP